MVVKGLFERIKQMAAIIIPVTGSAMNRAEIQSWVLEARGFTSVGKKTSLYEFSPDKIDYLFGFVAIGLMALNSYLLIRFGYLVDPLGWNTRLIPIFLLFLELNFIAFTILALTPVFKNFYTCLGLRVKKGDRH